MKEKYTTITKSKNSYNKKPKINEDTSYANYYSSSTHLKNRHLIFIIEILLCIKNCAISLKNFIFKLISRLSFLMQSMIFKIPIIVFFFIVLGVAHIIPFESLYFTNYFFAIKNEYLNKMTKVLDNKLFELDTLEFQYSFDEAEELIFFNVYYKELINMGLLDDKRINNSEIFSPINNKTGSIYSEVNKINKKFETNNDYIISADDANNGFLKSNSSLCELAKMYFYLLPAITVEQIKQNIFLNQSFLIIYEYNDILDEIDDDDYFYFSYPLSTSMFNSRNNFNPGNVKTNPKIFMSNRKNISLNSKNENNDYDEENWFSNQDYLFRINSSNINKSIISFQHLNNNYFSSINKTFIITMQSYYEKNNKKYIINLIKFFHQNNYTEDTKSFSIFLLNNSSDLYKPLKTEKYSNNETFVISHYNITEVSMGNLLEHYFHYGIKDHKNNYYQYGVSFDNFDLNKMSNPAIFYDTIDEYYSDELFIATLHFYGKLFQLSQYNITQLPDHDLNVYEFYNEYTVNSICSTFEFSLYIQILKDFKINCDNFEMYTNKNNNTVEYSNKMVLYCGCFPLQCIDTSTESIEEQYKKNKYNLKKKIIYPNKCVNDFFYYEKGESKQKSSFTQNTINRYISKDELNYIVVSNIELITFPGISYLFIISVDNTYLTKILSGLAYKLTITDIYILLLILIWIIIFLIISIIFTIIEAKKFSKLIDLFHTKFDKYMHHLEESGLNDNLMFLSDNNISKSEKDPLLGNNISRTKSFKVNSSFFHSNYNYLSQDYNLLLNELYNMFCEYYKLDPQKAIKDKQKETEKSKKEIKSDIMKEKNELFELFIKLCSYESKINLNLEYNLYSDNPLIQKYNNSLKKGKIYNINEEKFTRDVLYEILSTESIYDEGLVTNLNFAYISYLNVNESKAIKNAFFNKSTNIDQKNFNIKQRFKDDQRRSLIKLLLKNKNVIYNELEKFYDLDEIKPNKIGNFCNQFLLNVYYKYLKKILK